MPSTTTEIDNPPIVLSRAITLLITSESSSAIYFTLFIALATSNNFTLHKTITYRDGFGFSLIEEAHG